MDKENWLEMEKKMEEGYADTGIAISGRDTTFTPATASRKMHVNAGR